MPQRGRAHRSRGSRPPARSCSARPTCRLCSPTGRATTTIYGITNNPWDLDAHAGRLVGRVGGGARRRVRPAVARLRHRRLAARAGALLRRLRRTSRRSASCPRAAMRRPARRRCRATRPRRRRADGAHRRRPRAAARRHGRPGRTDATASATGSRCRRRGTSSWRISACWWSTRIRWCRRRRRCAAALDAGRPARARPASGSRAATRCCPISPRRRGSTCGC